MTDDDPLKLFFDGIVRNKETGEHFAVYKHDRTGVLWARNGETCWRVDRDWFGRALERGQLEVLPPSADVRPSA